MEDLTKHQLILLNLLVTFVTSIATGIITFTLLQEAPIEVTQTINRVVERTIEKVAPSEEGGKEIVREVQVINEEDLVLKSIESNSNSIVRIKTTGSDGSEIISGIGLVVSPAGYIMLDSRSYNANAAMYAVFSDGRSYSIEKVHSGNGMTFLKLSMKGHDGANTFVPVRFGNSDTLQLGQTVIRVSGKSGNSVTIGRVSELNKLESKAVTKIMTDVRLSGFLPGSSLINTTGEIIGLEASGAEGENGYSFVPINSLKETITAAVAELAK